MFRLDASPGSESSDLTVSVVVEMFIEASFKSLGVPPVLIHPDSEASNSLSDVLYSAEFILYDVNNVTLCVRMHCNEGMLLWLLQTVFRLNSILQHPQS